MRERADFIEEVFTFGQWVKHQRKALGLTQDNLAQRVACSKSMINKIESDLRSPAKPMIELLAFHLKISPADYARFVHLAQPNLLVDPADLPNKATANIAITLPKASKAYPIPLTPLIGREREVEAVCFSLQKNGIRLLTLTGPGGIGKTRLAVQVGAELKDKFADGVTFVSLAPARDPALVLSTIVQALGLKSMGDVRDDELLITYLHEKAVLLILDNFEQALPATKAISELLMFTAYVKVLVTSRAVLRLSGEYEFVVPPLGVPDLKLAVDPEILVHSPAVQLFVQQAQAVRADFELTVENAQAVAEICARLDGLPLALTLAAARCKVLSPRAILARLTGVLGSALGLLTGGVQDLPARQQTIRQTIDWSYNLLSEREQILFRRLGIFVGGCSLGAIEDVCGKLKTGPQPRLRPALDISALDSAVALVDQSLLRQVEELDGEPRFSMLEILREYAFECLITQNELELMRQQHAAYFLRLVDSIEPKLRGAEQEFALKRLDADYDNIRAALTWSCAYDIEMALRMAAVLWEYWLSRGYLSEGRAWLTDILQKSGTIPSLPVRIRAQALNGAGLLISVQGDQPAASIYLQESLRLFRELDDRVGEAWVLNHQGQTLNLSGQQEQAVPVFEASLELFRALGDNWHSAWVLINLGDVSLQRDETERALQFFSDACDLFTVLNHKRGKAHAIDRLGRLAILRRDSNQATNLYAESLRLFGEIGELEGCAWALQNLGRAASESGQRDQAIGYLIESLRLFGNLNDRWGFAWSLLRLAIVVRDLEQPEQAGVLFGAADAMLADFHGRLFNWDHRDFIKATLAEARTQSDTTAWASGRALSIEKILVWILEQPLLKV
ncbi:MAG: tetratricopeptide repeat protein [Chloroflexi bacterium]|nr:tetratricopeptide repeat protein [Chloroflexota bacterium]